MGLVFFIETEKKKNQATPFNILPLQFAKRADFLELAAILPCSPLDISCGWVRPRHFVGFSPLINFYSKEDLAILLKNLSFLTKTQFKFFLAWKNFSIDLIQKCSTDNAPSIVLTDNKLIADHFKSNRNVKVVLYNKNQTREEIYRKCNYAVIDLFASKGERNFTDKPVTTESYQSYCLQKSFLPDTQLTSNILCNANEIALAQVRGRIPKTLSKEDSPPLDTADAYSLNVRVMEEILAERLIDIMLGPAPKEMTSILRNVPSLLQKHIDEFLNKVYLMSTEMKKESYALLKEIALSSMKEIHTRSETILLIPTVNPECRKHVISELEKNVDAKERNVLGYLVDRVLEGGRGISFDPSQLNERLIEIARELANTRIVENTFLTHLVGLLASRKLSPVLKSVTVPSSLFDDIQAIRTYIGLNYLTEREKPEWCMTVGENFQAFQVKLSSCIPDVYMDAIERVNPSYITIVSDLPFEIAYSSHGMTVCQSFATTRIPITPLGALFHHYNIVSGEHFVGKHMQSIKDVLFLNSIHKKDRLYSEFKLFELTCKHVGLNFETRTILNSNDFISALNSTKSQILVYFGHGSYNTQKDEGELIFRDDRLSYKCFENVTKFPPIIFLIGCETASCSAFMGGLPPHLLERGAFAVLASIFPIPADDAGAFLGRTLAFSNDLIKRGKTTTFSELVFHARKLGWIKDNLNLLWKNGTVSLVEGAKIMQEVSEIATELSLKRGSSLPLSEAALIFESVLDSHDALKPWRQIKQNIVPYSLFLTLLGDAHDVFIGG